MLTRIAATVVLAATVAACASASPSAPPGASAEPVVAATWIADDGSVVALNVVLPRTMQPGGLAALAQRFRDEHRDARVVVRFFPSTAGGEQFVVGYVPTDGGSLPPTAGPGSALATFDFPAPTSSATGGAP